MSTPIFPTRALSFAICAGVLLLTACDSGELSAPQDATTLSPIAVSAAMSKIDVCHRTNSGDYTKISIADAAYDTHRAHGDGPVGARVPGNEGYAFLSDCETVRVVAYCPCYQTVAELGDLQGEAGLVIEDDPFGSWEASLTSGTASASAWYSSDSHTGACAITQSDGSGKSFADLHASDLNECRGVLEQNEAESGGGGW